MLAATHFAVGIAGGLLIAPHIGRWDNSTVAILSGFWALVPDIGNFIPAFESILTGWWGNVFWLHTAFDAAETAYPNVETLASMAFLLFTVALLERKGYYES